VTFDSAEAGVDLILQIANKKQRAVEIGMGKKEFRQVKNTMAKVRCDYGLVICGLDFVHLSKEDNIIKIPLKYFLLM
jgi:hypothetical protein